MATLYSDLGNGTGFIYVTAADGTTVINSMRNDTVGRNNIRNWGVARGPQSSATVQYDSVFNFDGVRAFLSSNASALEGVVYGADNIEITRNVIGRDNTVPLFTTSATIASGIATYTRVGNEMLASIDTEGAAASDNLDTITISDAVTGDRLIIYGANDARIVTVKHGTGNILLANSTDFSTSTKQRKIVLQYLGAPTSSWLEVSRASVFPTVTELRNQSIAQGVSGVTSTTITNAGGTLNLTPGTSTIYQRFSGSGVVLSAPYTVAFAGTPLTGDSFTMDFVASVDLNGQTISLGGAFLTTDQADKGLTRAVATYNGTTWDVVLMPLSNTTNYVDTTDLATKENSLGTPAADGYILSSTTADARSWIPIPNSLLTNDTSNNQTTAITTEETLKSYTVAGNTLDTNGDALEIIAVYQTAANANNKTMNIKFGATTVFSTGAQAFNNQTIFIRVRINRITATTQSAIGSINGYPGFNIAASYTTPAETLTANVSVLATGQNGTAAAGDIICRHLSIQKLDK